MAQNLFFELNKIQKIFKDIYLITGHQCALFDPEYRALLRYPAHANEFCQHIQSTAVGKSKCEACDLYGFRQAKETGKLCVYQCHAGLIEVCVPIKSGQRGDEVLGYVVLGHLLDDQTSLGSQWNTVYENCRHFIRDMSVLNHQFFQLIPTSRSCIAAMCDILQICIEHLLLQKLIQRNRDDLWQRAQAYIDENLREKLPVTEIAKALSVSVSTLNRCAEKNVNMAIGKFILQKRIMLACKYLKDPKYNISEIAGNCGITDYNYFSRVFKLKTGMTPREYRTVFLRSGKVPELPDPDKLTLSQVTLSGGEQQ